MADDQSSIPGLGFALGGGAFRGAVHPGVLKALEEEGFTAQQIITNKTLNIIQIIN